MPTPGRPVSPTIHPRTTPEATENASKNRQTNDWFRHDGKNVQQRPQPPTRLTTDKAVEIAHRGHGEQGMWFAQGPVKDQDVKNGKTTPSPMRCTTTEAKQNFQKVKGTQEDWFKHEENVNYAFPRPKSRLTSHDALESRTKNERASVDWYHHEHGPNDAYSPPKARPKTANARSQLQGASDWFSHTPTKDHVDASPMRGSRGVATPEAEEFMQRDRHGTAENWFGHHATPELQQCLSPRVHSVEGMEYAEKGRHESENWFDHEANKDYHSPQRPPRCTSAAAKEMMDRNRGNLSKIFKHDDNKNYYSARGEPRAVKPEARENAERNTQGTIGKYLDLNENQDYQSARPAPRVKSEAKENFEKNKGVMDEMMEGYPDQPPKRDVQRIKPEGAANASRNQGSLDTLMNGNLPESDQKNYRVKPEAEQYAERNKGTLSDMMTNYGSLEINDRPAPRLNTSEAQANAQKYQGSGAMAAMNWS